MASLFASTQNLHDHMLDNFLNNAKDTLPE